MTHGAAFTTAATAQIRPETRIPTLACILIRQSGKREVAAVAGGGNERGLSALELIIATSVLGIVVIASVLSPSLGVQTALTGIAILMNLRRPPQP